MPPRPGIRPSTPTAIRDGAWVAGAAHPVDLSQCPTGTRLVLPQVRPHPGAQLRFTDSDGHRGTGFLTDNPDGQLPGQLAGLELRHRQHARVDERIRQAKATGLRNLPFSAFEAQAISQHRHLHLGPQRNRDVRLYRHVGGPVFSGCGFWCHHTVGG